MKNMIELTGASFEREVLSAAGPVIVDFYAPWCGPCKMLEPLLDMLAGEFSGKLKFVKLNVDDGPELASEHAVTGVPTLMLFCDGNAIDQLVGFPAPRSLKAWLENAASGSVAALTKDVP